MEIDITGLESEFHFEHHFSIDEKKMANVIDILNFEVNGFIEEENIEIKLSGILLLRSDLTLNEIEHPFEISIIGNVYQLLEDIDVNFRKSGNTIDIFPIVWENILMEIPMKVISPDEKIEVTKGEGWELITDNN